MLVTKEVEVTLNGNQVSRYEDLGYEIPKYYNKDKKRMAYKKGTKLLIKVEDLTHSSHMMVAVRCDYCEKSKKLAYRDYFKTLNSNKYVKKYACEECSDKKKKEIVQCKQENNMLNKTDKGYWTIQENRTSELKGYIKKYKYLDRIDSNEEGKLLAANIRIYEKGGVKGLAKKSGFNLDEVYESKHSRKEIMPLSQIISTTQKFIDKHKRFPSYKDYLKTLSIPASQLKIYDGIVGIKKIMNYKDDNDLVDDSGFYNRSSYEYMVAQFLLKHNIIYKRECNPFPKKEGGMRSDFTFELNDGNIIHCEVWGYPEYDATKRGLAYKKNKLKKSNLYKKYNISLIEIEYDIFQNSHDNTINSLMNIFSNYLNLDFKELSYEDITPANMLSDDDILKYALKISKDKNFLPRSEDLNSNIYYQIMKRHGTYLNFAKKYNKQSSTFRTTDIFWTKNKVFEVFDKMIFCYGMVLNKNEIKQLDTYDMEIKRIFNGTAKFGGMTKCKLEYFTLLLNEDKNIPVKEIVYLEEIAQLKKSFRKNISDNLKNEALNILNQIKNKEVSICA